MGRKNFKQVDSARGSAISQRMESTTYRLPKDLINISLTKWGCAPVGETQLLIPDLEIHVLSGEMQMLTDIS